MSATVKSMGIDQLSREDRLALVHEIWDGIAAESDSSLLSDAQRQELRRRVAEDDSAPDNVVPWEVVKAETLSKIKKQ